MKMNLEISNPEDAIVAQRVLSAYASDIKVEVVEKAEKPVAKKKAVKKPTDEANDNNGEAEDVEDNIEEKPAAKKKATKTTIKSLQELAKKAIAESDKLTVKAIISKYGPNISSIDEDDYEGFKAELEVLIEEV